MTIRSYSGHNGAVSCCVCVGKWILSAGHDKLIRAYDAETGDEKFHLEGHSHIVQCLDAFVAADGRRLLASGSWDKSVKVWDLNSGLLIHDFPLSHNNRVRCVRAMRKRSASCDDTLVSGGDDGVIVVRNFVTGALLHLIRAHSRFVYDLAELYCPGLITKNDIKPYIIASGSSDRSIRLWLIDGEHFNQVQTIHYESGELTALAAVPIHVDNTTRLTGMAQSSEALAKYLMDSYKLISGDSSGTITIFDRCATVKSIFTFSDNSSVMQFYIDSSYLSTSPRRRNNYQELREDLSSSLNNEFHLPAISHSNSSNKFKSILSVDVSCGSTSTSTSSPSIVHVLSSTGIVGYVNCSTDTIHQVTTVLNMQTQSIDGLSHDQSRKGLGALQVSKSSSRLRNSFRGKMTRNTSTSDLRSNSSQIMCIGTGESARNDPKIVNASQLYHCFSVFPSREFVSVTNDSKNSLEVRGNSNTSKQQNGEKNFRMRTIWRLLVGGNDGLLLSYVYKEHPAALTATTPTRKSTLFADKINSCVENESESALVEKRSKVILQALSPSSRSGSKILNSDNSSEKRMSALPAIEGKISSNLKQSNPDNKDTSLSKLTNSMKVSKLKDNNERDYIPTASRSGKKRKKSDHRQSSAYHFSGIKFDGDSPCYLSDSSEPFSVRSYDNRSTRSIQVESEKDIYTQENVNSIAKANRFRLPNIRQIVGYSRNKR